MTSRSGTNGLASPLHPTGLERNSVEAMSRSSVSSESTTSQTASASIHTAPIPPTNAYASTHFASDDRNTGWSVSERPKQSRSRHEYRGSQVPDDTLSSSHGADAPVHPPLLNDSELADLKSIEKLQNSIPHPISGTSTAPDYKSFKNLSLSFVLEEFPAHLKHQTTSKIILVLHDYGGNELSLKDFAEEHLREPNALYILLRGTRALTEVDRYHWADSNQLPNRSFLEATDLIGNFVVEGLIKRHNISPRNIVLLGHGQGGMAALSVAISWNRTELGGVITIGGPLPEHFTLPPRANVSTPVLALGGKLGDINATAEKRIRDFVMHVDVHLIPDVEDRLPQSTDSTSILMLKEFFAHRLWRKEWEQPAVLTLDGGGIRGYGTLLILKELMNRIGVLEKKIDPETHSSFHPQPYRPISGSRPPVANGLPATLERRATNFVEPTLTEGLLNSELFYPCHYFSYIGGTSTGGLISIMLSRLRMSVEDSLTEYKRLGGQVFGSPRPIPNKGIAWHKFSWRRLHTVIDDVVQRHHSRTNEIRYTWPSEIDFCRTIVVAYASTNTTEVPYLFRTYEALEHEELERRPTINNVLNPGPAQNLEIPLVGRATSAAPGYFAPAEVRVSDRQTIKFKDGGFGCNNPSDEVRRDIRALHGGSNKNLGPFISIGTGTDKIIEKFPKEGVFRHIRGFWRNLKSSTDMVTFTANAHRNMNDAASDGDDINFPYFRFDGGTRLGQMKMDAWLGRKLVGITGRDPTPGCKTIDEIDTAVAMYLQDPKVSADLDAVAELLVRRRRYRIRDESQWDRYACASWYQCPYNCKERKRYDTLTAFREHVLSDHKYQVPLEVLETELAKFRHCWTYPVREKKVAPAPVDAKEKGVQPAVNGFTNGHVGIHTTGVLSRAQVDPEPRRIVRHASV